jgi:hypothetical protein
MKKTFPLLLFCVALAAFAQDLPRKYADRGELILTQMVTAPFPHLSRANGHTYKEQLYSAKDHYSNNTVALFIPKGFRQTAEVDFVIHFHGWRNTVAGALGKYQLIEQFCDSGRNAILVVPQGPYDAPDSFGGKLEDPDGFKRFLQEVVQTLQVRVALKKECAIGKIILSGHSGGYQVISSILDRGGLSDHIAEVWLFDALYAQTDKFLAWFDTQHGRLLNIYTEHGGTKAETEKLMDILKKQGTHFFSGQEADCKPADLRGSMPIFLFTTLEHDDVLSKHSTFREFLETSSLQEIKTTK